LEKKKKEQNQNNKYNNKENVNNNNNILGGGGGSGGNSTGAGDDEEEPVPTVYCISTIQGLQKNDRKWLKMSGVTEEITIENFSVVLHVLNFLRRKELIYYKFIDQPEQIIQLKESMATQSQSTLSNIPSVVISSVKSTTQLLLNNNQNNNNSNSNISGGGNGHNSQSSPIVCGMGMSTFNDQNQCSFDEFIVDHQNSTLQNDNNNSNNINNINNNNNNNNINNNKNISNITIFNNNQQNNNNSNNNNGTILQQQNNTILITPQSLSTGLSHSYYYPGKKKRIDSNRVFISPGHFCKYPEEIDIAIEKLLNQGNPKELYKNLYFEAKGGFGSVFLAKNKNATSHDKQMVAVKKMPHKTLRQKRMNLNEIGFLKYCDHPNIVKLLCSFLKNDELWLIMELMEGGTLREAVANFSFCESKIAYICKETLKAIQYLHSNGLCHRDLKSSNIMISMNGEIKLIDFGLAVDFNIEKEDIHMCGSPFWMPPEQILGKPHSLPVDIWSFGVCVVEMLKRKVPNHNSRLKAMITVATEGLIFTKLEYPDWSDQVLDFLSKCLQIDPLKRANVDELLAHPFLDNCCDIKEIKDILPALFMSNTLSKQGIF